MPSQFEIIQSADRASRRFPLKEKARQATILERESRQSQAANDARSLGSSAGEMIAYDQSTGLFNFRTNLGGTVQAGSNTTAGIATKQITPLSIEPGSPSRNFDAKPQSELAAAAETLRQQGALFGSTDPTVSGRWDRDLFVEYTDDTYAEINSIWVWNALTTQWIEFAGGGGIVPLVGDGPPSNATGVEGDLYIDNNYSGNSGHSLYYKQATYSGSTDIEWFKLQISADFFPPSGQPDYQGQIKIDRGATVWTDSFSTSGWTRNPQNHYNPDFLIADPIRGDLVFVDAPTNTEDVEVCGWVYTGTEWKSTTATKDSMGNRICPLTPPDEAPYGPSTACSGFTPFETGEFNGQPVCSSSPPVP